MDFKPCYSPCLALYQRWHLSGCSCERCWSDWLAFYYFLCEDDDAMPMLVV